MRCFNVMALSLSLFLGAANPQTGKPQNDRTQQQELEKISGVWAEVGDKLPSKEAKARLIYQGGQFEGRLGETLLFDGEVKLDPTKSPREIDMTLHSGPNKGKTLLGVYELDAENYRGCLAAPGSPRPKTLTPAPDSGQQAFAFHRVSESAEHNAKSGTELKQFEGTWSYLSVVIDGKPVPKAALKENRLICSGSAFTVKTPQVTMHGSYSVDSTTTPKAIEVTFSDGPRAGKSIKGIYELTGDTCTVCMAPEDQPRPNGFDSKSGTGHTLEMMRRTKP